MLPVEAWGPNRFFTTPIGLRLPAGLAAGRYDVVIGVYDRTTGERMALQTDPIVEEAEATKGEDATKIGVGAGAGAVIGAIVGGKSGAAKGALLGGAAGNVSLYPHLYPLRRWCTQSEGFIEASGVSIWNERLRPPRQDDQCAMVGRDPSIWKSVAS